MSTTTVDRYAGVDVSKARLWMWPCAPPENALLGC
jgi:hypothetical protein